MAPGGSTTFTVKFTPSTNSTFTAVMRISSNDADENPFDLALRGTGTIAVIKVEDDLGTAISNPSSCNFGSLVVGTHATMTFTIKNTGSAPLTGLQTTMATSSDPDFTVTETPVAPVAPGGSASTTFTVRFAPMVAGSRHAQVRIASNTSNGSDFAINLCHQSWRHRPRTRDHGEKHGRQSDDRTDSHL